ncbi:MAG: hypothetical protein BGO86_04370 [Chryseobacterium sp. 36-9]|nr:MAG: hypothetical protein BGO86_04370 [Chryseobacterium sp. 36-9]
MKIYGETLPYCLIMINKYNYKHSYSKIAEEIISINNGGHYDIMYLGKLNEGDKKFIMYYLNLGLKENDIECIFLCEKIYRNGFGFKKNVIIADSLNHIYASRIKNKR